MNITQLAEKITKMEGKKKPVSIAQVKEVLRCLADAYWEDENGVGEAIGNYIEKRKPRSK